MHLALDISLTGLSLGVDGVEFEIKVMFGGFTSVDGAANRFRCIVFHRRTSFVGWSRSPKNFGPFQRVPVIANATCDRLG